jgi:hypothetical protein
MFQPILSLQWKSTRWGVLLLTPVCVGLPILLLRLAHQATQQPYSEPALDMIRFVQILVPIFPMLAAVSGAAIALAVWNWDHRTNHIYALSLPLERWRYAMLKLSAGAVMLAIPVAGVFVGALLAVLFTPIPPGAHAYPIAFGMRFLLASLIIYTVTFAFAAGTMRTTLRIFVAVFLIFVFGSLLTGAVGDAFNVHIPSPLELLVDALTSWPGPFSVFGGSWMLIDV